MPAVTLTLEDLDPFVPDFPAAKGQAMIDDALATARVIAPCIKDDAFDADKAAMAKAILRGAVLRWNEAGTGAIQQQAAGPFSMAIDTRQQRRGMFWPSEIEQLQELCRDAADGGGAFTVDSDPLGGYGPGFWSSTDTWTPLP